MSELVPADDGTIETASLVMKVIELASNPNTNPDMFDRLVAWQESGRSATVITSPRITKSLNPLNTRAILLSAGLTRAT